MAEEAIRVFLIRGGRVQEEPGIIMRVQLATGVIADLFRRDNVPGEHIR